MSIAYTLRIAFKMGNKMRGDRLKELREGERLTQKDLAERLGISEIQVHRYETGGAEPRADAVIKMAEYFNVSTDYLLGVTPERGSYFQERLEPKEARVISAWRRGERLEAIKGIADDE